MIFQVFLLFALASSVGLCLINKDFAFLLYGAVASGVVWGICFCYSYHTAKEELITPVRNDITGEIRFFEKTRCNPFFIPEWAVIGERYHKYSDEYEFLLKKEKAEKDSP